MQKKGRDVFGNVYYESNSKREFGRKKRFAKYSRGNLEIDKGWFNWLHYRSDEVPMRSHCSHILKYKSDVSPEDTRKSYIPWNGSLNKE